MQRKHRIITIVIAISIVVFFGCFLLPKTKTQKSVKLGKQEHVVEEDEAENIEHSDSADITDNTKWEQNETEIIPEDNVKMDSESNSETSVEQANKSESVEKDVQETDTTEKDTNDMEESVEPIELPFVPYNGK